MTPPSRRQLLSALAAGASALLAGCTAPVTEPTGTRTTADGTTTPTDSPGPVPSFPDNTTSTACPPFEAAQRVVCYEAVDPDAMPLVLVPERRPVRPDRSTEFTLRNRSDQRFQTNHYHWQLHKRVDGEWYYIAPESYPEPLTPLAAGEDHSWTLTVVTADDGASIETVQGTDSLTVAGLGGGQYAFGTDGWFASGSYEEPIAVAASFELDAAPLELTPTDAVTETARDGDTLVARSTRGEPDEDENGDRRDAYILERTDDPEARPEPVIVEQVVRDDQLRDAIALSRREDADRVRIEEFSNSVPPFGLDEARTYAFRGTYYRVRTREGGSSSSWA